MEPGRVEILTADASRQAFSVKDLAEVWQDHGRERMVRTLQELSRRRSLPSARSSHGTVR